MGKKIAVVTGASSGFGLLTSLELARKGFTVFATMRDTEKSTELVNAAKNHRLDSKVIIHQLDVTNEESINKLKTRITAEGRIDVLINNAGYAGAGFVEEIPMLEYRRQFETNVFGVMAVTKAFLPLMRSQGHGNIITISSISGKIAFPGLSPYSASKHAVEGWSESLRLEMKPFGVSVSLIEPGSYTTNIWSTGKQVTRLTESDYHAYMEKIEQYIEAGEKNYGDPQDVAKKIAEIAIMKRPAFRYPMGRGVKFTIYAKNLLSWSLWEKMLLKKLFRN
jgi:NAD(P)-dependent dehydrogenase (short-subunit alcohol dehydrogenase family)